LRLTSLRLISRYKPSPAWSNKVEDRLDREESGGLGVFYSKAAFLNGTGWYAACITSGMLTMLTTPGLTLLFLGVVVGLGTAFVWMLWEIEQTSKSRRNSDRFGYADGMLSGRPRGVSHRARTIIRGDGRTPLDRQPSTLYFLNQVCIWPHASSAASLR
jgi:hypothetical protein